MSDEDGLATPFDDDLNAVLKNRFNECDGISSRIGRSTHVLALGDGAQVNFDLGHGQNIGGSGHVDEELWGFRVSFDPLSIQKSTTSVHEACSLLNGWSQGHQTNL